MNVALPPTEQGPESPKAADATEIPTSNLAWSGLLVGLGGIALTSSTPSVVRAITGLALLVVLPTWVLARRAFHRASTPVHRLVYAFGLTLLGLIAGGLVLNSVLPLIGIERPLARPYVVLSAASVGLTLLWWRPSVPVATRHDFKALVALRWPDGSLLAAASIVLAVAGAVRLDDGGGPLLAVAGHLVAGLGLLRMIVSKRRSVGADSLVIALVSTSLLLSTSLRGRLITGHDIQREFIAYILTQQSDRWRMEVFQNAYNACLSINILPTMLANATGLSGVTVFKVLLQLMFVVVPVVVYVLGRRFVPRRVAVIGAIVFISFPTFANDMPYLVRQEIAFVFVALATLAAFEPRWGWRLKFGVSLAFGAGVVLSHYSTTYTLLLALGLGSVMFHGQVLMSRRRSRGVHLHPQARPVLLHPLMVAALVAMTWAWTNPATSSGGHFVETVRATVYGLVDGTSGPGSSDLGYGLLSGAQATPQERLDMYAEQLLRDRDPAADYLIVDPTRDEALPRAEDPPTIPLTSVGRAMESVGLDASSVSTGIRLAAAAALQILLLIGLAAVFFRLGHARRIHGEYRWLCIGTLAALAVQVVVPGLSAEYGVLRAFQQALLVLAPVLAAGLALALAPLRRASRVLGLVVVSTLYLVLSGVVPTIIGGYPGQLALANSGLYYDLYYVTPGEAAGGRWLADASGVDRVQSEVVSERTSALRLGVSTQSRLLPASEFFPTEIRQDSYVFLNRANARERRATVFYSGDIIGYRYPVGFLDRRLDLLYDSGDARVYR